jgi:hypothetical protein
MFDMVATIKLCQADFFSWYIDLDTVYSANVFRKFKDVLAYTSDVFVYEWLHDMNLERDTLSMCLGVSQS